MSVLSFLEIHQTKEAGLTEDMVKKALAEINARK
jgi:hypothetical protein